MNFNLLTLKLKLGKYRGPNRIVTIPDFYTFGHLHKLMVFLFEWDDDHLHKFMVPDKSPSISDIDPEDPLFYLESFVTHNDYIWVSNPMSFIGESKEQNENNVLLSTAFGTVDDSVEYEYDFGDSWKVTISLKQIETRILDKNYIPSVNVVGGRGKTIPEYSQEGGTTYNKNRINRELSERHEFVYFNESELPKHGANPADSGLISSERGKS